MCMHACMLRGKDKVSIVRVMVPGALPPENFEILRRNLYILVHFELTAINSIILADD